MDEVKVLIGIPTAEFARRADFYDYVDMLEMPLGTMKMKVHGQSPARNRNIIIDSALKNNCTHILFLDDDVIFQSNLLIELLKHDKDIVTGLYLMRSYPHQPIIFKSIDLGTNEYRHYYPTGYETDLVEVVSCGLGAVLIKTDVFKAMERPWIRLGEIENDHWCDDTSFFKRASQAGFKVHCDLNIPVGHIFSGIVWPNKVGNEWFTTYDTHGTGVVNFVAAKPDLEDKQLVLEMV